MARVAPELDETKGGKPNPDSPDHPELPAPPAHADRKQRQQLEDRLATAQNTDPSLRKLRERAERLPPGSPSSPYAEDGTPRPHEPSLKEIELPEPPLTDAQWADHRQEVTDRLDKARAEGLTTQLLHTVNPDHDIWSDERTQLHDQILSDLHAAAADVPSERKAVIAGGLGGAGKSTVLDQHPGIDQSQYVTINPDRFKEELAKRGLLPEIPGLSPMERSTFGHSESSYLARRFALRAMADGKNIIWDITMSSVDTTTERIDELRNAGYQEIEGIFVDISIDVSIGRAEARHRHGHDLYLAGLSVGGRPLPTEITRSQADTEYGSINRRAFEMVKSRLNRWAIYDNSVDGRDPVLIERSGQQTTAASDDIKEPPR